MLAERNVVLAATDFVARMIVGKWNITKATGELLPASVVRDLGCHLQ
jgi:hypothetical protein